MVFGLDDEAKKATAVKDKQDGKKDAKAEADELLKQMQEKEDDGNCAFC